MHNPRSRFQISNQSRWAVRPNVSKMGSPRGVPHSEWSNRLFSPPPSSSPEYSRCIQLQRDGKRAHSSGPQAGEAFARTNLCRKCTSEEVSKQVTHSPQCPPARSFRSGLFIPDAFIPGCVRWSVKTLSSIHFPIYRTSLFSLRA